MLSDDLKVTDGASAGAWIEPRLAGEFGAVTIQVPKGFDAYARALHPAQDSERNPIGWAKGGCPRQYRPPRDAIAASLLTGGVLDLIGRLNQGCQTGSVLRAMGDRIGKVADKHRSLASLLTYLANHLGGIVGSSRDCKAHG
jgi:hypothetical protein